MTSNVMLRTNLVLVIVLVIFLNYPEHTSSAETKRSLKGFFDNSRQQKGKDIKNRDIREHHEYRFLSDTPGAVFINVISIVSGIFTIWIWIESRERKHRKGEETNELLEEWNSQLEHLNSRMEDLKNSMKELVCRFDYVHTKSKTISRECSQFIQPEPKHHYHFTPNKVTPSTKLPYKRKNNENKNTLLETYQLDSLQRLLKTTVDKLNEND